MPLRILYEDNHLLAVFKPAGVATMGVKPGEPSLIQQAKQYLKQKYHKPGNVYLGVVSRLDALVSGVIVLARTSKAAARLTEQFKKRTVQKTYWAVVEGHGLPSAGTFEDWLVKDESAQRMRVVKPGTSGAQAARLSFRRLRELPDATLLEVQLETGRKHQIRVQFAERGHPILGDKKYGGQRSFPGGIALHARQLCLTHPVTKEEVDLLAPLGVLWKKLGIID